jgi:hypothetical protein
MGKEINIAEILKDKPQGTKLYDLLYNVDVELDTISTTDKETVVWCTNKTDNNTTCHRGYSEFGTVRGCPDGLQILLPSKEMRDWRKFDWKKGDVLVSNDSDSHIIFKGFSKDDYTIFEGKHWISVSKKRHISCLNMQNTQNYHIEDNKEVAQTYINTIEERLGGKFNRETLEVEKPHPEFKDGDIITITPQIGNNLIFIFRAKDVEKYYCHAYLDGNIAIVNDDSYCQKYFCTARPSTEEEQKQLFDALAKKGKAWDAVKKQIVDLKPKIELKPFDKVLVRNRNTQRWDADLFGFKSDGVNFFYHCVSGSWNFCIPYIGNESLLGTTKDAEK